MDKEQEQYQARSEENPGTRPTAETRLNVCHRLRRAGDLLDIALLVLGPERLPQAARATGRWIGGARRMVSQFTSELDRQLKAEELREELRKAGDVGLDDVQNTVSEALSEARRYEHMIVSDDDSKLAPPQTKTVATSSLTRPTAPAQSSPESRPGDNTAGNQQDPLQSEMPLVEHLLELRNRLLKMVLAVIICFAAVYPFANELYLWLSQPLRDFCR